MCFGGREDGGEGKRSRDIDAMIHRDEKAMSRQVKLLLLGESVPRCSTVHGDHPKKSKITSHHNRRLYFQSILNFAAGCDPMPKN
jgi:hypothetical protein